MLARLSALRAALKKSSGVGGGSGLGHAVRDAFETGGRTRRGYAMRERRLAPGAMAEDALGESLVLFVSLHASGAAGVALAECGRLYAVMTSTP